MGARREDPPGPEPAKPSPAREEEERRARARAELGIAALRDGEELIDAETFSSLHARLAQAQEQAQGGPPAAAGAEELLLEEIATELPADRPRCEAASAEEPAGCAAPEPSELAELESRLAASQDRDEVARRAVRIARAYASVAGLLVVNQGMVAGLHGEGAGIEQRIDGLVISAAATRVFGTPALEARVWRGPAPDADVDAKVFRALGRAEAADVLVVPVEIRGRGVNLLYADNGAARLSETAVAALEKLGHLVAAAYEALILARKSLGSA